ncbi:AzlC family ABC transporter permease [Pseudonocardia sp. C8]|uniref:AzlC family ABC transporter permease n=1 Tax=Pseudonocardia sp. C8 TaxID=2762759 RepID=UPI001642CE2A|nr:AzlC family ABC transporter permease [Pseudonocardia sp. C8]MBC3191014.1 AzlC family ABC transporter permease [Pseudonocardia sp. C8]
MSRLPASAPAASVEWPAARAGSRDAVAVIVAYTPFGMALGATLAAGGVDPLVAWASSPLLFGGAAQLLAVQMLGSGASAPVVVAAALVVNARMLLYSASLAPHARDWPARWRWPAAYLLADPVYALAIARFGRPDGGGGPRARLAYYLGVGLTLWPAWQLITAAGTVLAGALPAAVPLELAGPLTFLLLLLPMLASRAAYGAAAVGAGVAVAASGLPLGLGVLAGAAAGTAAGAMLEAHDA